MRRLSLVLAAFALAGCMRLDDSRERRLEEKVTRLQERTEALEHENMQLRARIDALEAARGESAAAVPPAPPAGPIRARCKVDGDHYTLSGDEIDEVFANPSGLATEMRLVPYFDGGVAKGFKMFSVRPDTLVASCGFHNGDVLEAVNGFPLTTPDKALDAYAQAKKAATIDFRVKRNGAHVDVTIAKL